MRTETVRRMNLYSIHCGFYDQEVSEGIYEFHVNIPIIAQSILDAKNKIRCNPAFQKKKMHIDGIQEIKMVDGYRLDLILNERFDLSQTVVLNHLHRDL